MDECAFRRVAGAFRRFHKRFAPLFGRQEARPHSEQYLRGLLVQQEERRNAENLAEAVVGSASKDARARQQFRTDPDGLAVGRRPGDGRGAAVCGGAVVATGPGGGDRR